MPCEAPPRPTSVVEVEGWGEAVFVHRYEEMPVKEEVEVEEESVGKKETALRRLGRLLGMWKRENGGERDVAIVPGGIRQANV